MSAEKLKGIFRYPFAMKLLNKTWRRGPRLCKLDPSSWFLQKFCAILSLATAHFVVMPSNNKCNYAGKCYEKFMEVALGRAMPLPHSCQEICDVKKSVILSGHLHQHVRGSFSHAFMSLKQTYYTTYCVSSMVETLRIFTCHVRCGTIQMWKYWSTYKHKQNREWSTVPRLNNNKLTSCLVEPLGFREWDGCCFFGKCCCTEWLGNEKNIRPRF